MFGNNTMYEIRWFIMGVRILSSNPKYEINTVAGEFKKFSTQLCIRSLNYDDGGTYVCEMKLKSSPTKRAFAAGELQILGK